MGSGWMKAKVLKLKNQRRKAPKSAFLRKVSGPNREVIAQYQETAKGLGVEIAQVRFPNVAPGRKEIMDRVNTIGDPLRGIYTDIKDPLFVCILDNSRQRLRLYWNSQMTCFILQWVHWDKKWVRISQTYSSSARAKSAWESDRVIWKKEMKLP